MTHLFRQSTLRTKSFHIAIICLALVFGAHPMLAKKGGNGGGPGGGNGGGPGGGEEPSGPPNPEICFVEIGSNGYDLVVANVDGSNKTVLYSSPDRLIYPDFSATEEAIIFEEESSAPQLLKVDYSVSSTAVTLEESHVLAEQAEFSLNGYGDFGDWDISPDGQWLAFTFSGGSPYSNRIYLIALVPSGGRDASVPLQYIDIEDTNYYIWGLAWLRQSANQLAVSYADGAGNDALIVVEADPTNLPVNPIDVLNDTLAGPQNIVIEDGIASGAFPIESTRSRDGVLLVVDQYRQGSKGKRKQIDQVVYEWNPYPQPGEFAPMGNGNLIIGNRPVSDPLDSAVLLQTGWSSPTIELVPVDNPDQGVTLATDADFQDWKPGPSQP